jgi:hypothetical protein
VKQTHIIPEVVNESYWKFCGRCLLWLVLPYSLFFSIIITLAKGLVSIPVETLPLLKYSLLTAPVLAMPVLFRQSRYLGALFGCIIFFSLVCLGFDLLVSVLSVPSD